MTQLVTVDVFVSVVASPNYTHSFETDYFSLSLDSQLPSGS